MGSIQKTSNGKYKVRYRDPSGRQRYKTFDRRADAVSYLASIRGEISKGTWSDPKLGRILLEEWVEEWWPTTLNLRPSTRARDEQYMASYVLPQFGPIPLGAITPLEIRKWVAALHHRGLAPATIKKAYQILGKVMKAAVEVGLIPLSPCRGVSLPAVEPKEMRFLTPTEVELLAETVHPRYRALFLVAAYGGLRWAELAGLRKSRVDLVRGVIDVSETIVESYGKLLPAGPPKTKAGRRTVALPRSVVNELARHMNEYCNPSSDLVFQNTRGGPLRRATFRNRVWLPAVDNAGTAPLRFHDLRHTAISFWIAAGGHPREIARRAGHSSAAVVLDRYGHILPDADERLSENLDRLYQKARREVASREGNVRRLRSGWGSNSGGLN